MTEGDTGAQRYARLDSAFREGDVDALILEAGSLDGFPNVAVHPAIGGCLVYAIYHSSVRFIAALIDEGADPNWSEGDGFPPLIAALDRSDAATRSDVLELLLARGADVSQRNFNDYTPLHVAAARGDLPVVELLLANGADPNEACRIDDMELPVEVAERAGHSDVVARLRPLTVRLDWEEAVAAGDVRAMKRLVAAGHEIDAKDRYAQTALMRAAHAGRLDVVEWLVAQGADLDHTAKHRLSALMLAVIADHPRIARALVTAGADTTIRGSGVPGFDDMTAAELAEERGDDRLAAFIRSQRS